MAGGFPEQDRKVRISPGGSVFLINVPVMVLVIGAGLWLLPESRNERGAPIDLLSAALSVGAIVPMVYAVKSFAHDGPTLTTAISRARAGHYDSRATARRLALSRHHHRTRRTTDRKSVV